MSCHCVPLSFNSLISSLRCLYALINHHGPSFIQTSHAAPSSQDPVLHLGRLIAAQSCVAPELHIPNQISFVGMRLNRTSPSVSSLITCVKEVVINALLDFTHGTSKCPTRLIPLEKCNCLPHCAALSMCRMDPLLSQGSSCPLCPMPIACSPGHPFLS